MNCGCISEAVSSSPDGAASLIPDSPCLHAASLKALLLLLRLLLLLLHDSLTARSGYPFLHQHQHSAQATEQAAAQRKRRRRRSMRRSLQAPSVRYGCLHAHAESCMIDAVPSDSFSGQLTAAGRLLSAEAPGGLDEPQRGEPPCMHSACRFCACLMSSDPSIPALGSSSHACQAGGRIYAVLAAARQHKLLLLMAADRLGLLDRQCSAC